MDLKRLGILLLSLNTFVCSALMPQQKQDASNYPPVIEASPARQQAAEDAWNQFLSEYKLNFTAPDLEPILYTPRSLPPALAMQINLKPSDKKTDEPLDEAQAKEYLRRFIENHRAILAGDQRSSALSLKDLSLITFANEGNLYRAIYRQMNYPFPIENGYGELRFVLSKTGALLQLSSRLIPTVEFPTRPKLEAATLPGKFLGREFTYSNFAGQPLTYKVAQAFEITVRDLVVYPKVQETKMTLHLAYPVEVGRGTTWTIYVDAITGEELETKQNFQS
ncbi:MAG TPA: hypothetical protein VFZ34_21345 [Blastocatellia bacterium]|nr:hypothetical protein [Blastocatellia bacterium]